MAKFVFDVVVRMAESIMVEANDAMDARLHLDTVLEQRFSSPGFVDFEIVGKADGPMASRTDINDLVTAVKNSR